MRVGVLIRVVTASAPSAFPETLYAAAANAVFHAPIGCEGHQRNVDNLRLSLRIRCRATPAKTRLQTRSVLASTVENHRAKRDTLQPTACRRSTAISRQGAPAPEVHEALMFGRMRGADGGKSEFFSFLITGLEKRYEFGKVQESSDLCVKPLLRHSFALSECHPTGLARKLHGPSGYQNMRR